MSAIAYVQDGQIQKTTSQTSLSENSRTTRNNDVDKDTFLQLLVAQMQYQDPLEPTSNTEYISQYATFTQVEEMQNMATTMELSRASAYVGQEVIISTTNANGTTSTVQGRVDYVTYENNKAYVSVNENLYAANDIQTVVNKEYLSAYEKALEFNYRLSQLSPVANLLNSEIKEVTELNEIYNNMNDYEKTFIASDVVKKLKEYVGRADELTVAAQAKEEAAKDEHAD